MSDSQISRAYTVPALVFLAATVAMGVWLRAVLLQPSLAAGLHFPFMVHAHSHLAFFGWVSLALFGAVVHALPHKAQATSFYRVHAALLALANVAAFAAFLRGGYDALSIGLSVVHVALWLAFVVQVWPRAGLTPFYRAALVFLVLAGLATFAPLVVVLRGAADGWWAELAIKLFLIPFMNGWVTLGVLGAIAAAADYRGGRAALALISTGALPSTLLFLAAPPPTPALLLVGRAGTALVALGCLAFAAGLWRRGRLPSAWLHLGAAALLLRGGIELLAAFGVGAALMRSPPIVIAHLHLVLLGFVTASLLGTLLHRRSARWPAVLFGAGTALMLAALVASGWAGLYLLLARTGLDLTALLRLALGGGVLAAAGVLAALAPGSASPSSALALVAECRQAEHLVYAWDGAGIAEVDEKRSYRP